MSSAEKKSSKGKPKIRIAPPEYFLPRLPLHLRIAWWVGPVAAGIGVGMLIEKWIIGRIEEDSAFVTIGSKAEEPSETVAKAPLQQ